MALCRLLHFLTNTRIVDESGLPACSERRRSATTSMVVLGLALGLAPSVASAQLDATIAANRTSGLAPLAVRFDATGSDCNGNGTGNQWNQDLEQCLYSWDFGDPLAPPYQYGAAAQAGQATSANRAHGFIAGHVFENPGSYVVTLTIRNSQGQTATRTQTINVSGFSGTTYCVRATSSGAFTGCPAGATQITQSSFTSGVSTCTGGGGRRCLFRRGDSFTRNAELNPPNGPGIIGAFGSGARPIVTGSDLLMGTGGSDWRIMDIDSNGPAFSGGSHRLFYRTRIRNTGSFTGLGYWGTGFSNLYFVRSELDATGTGNRAYGYFVTAENQVVLGSRIANSGNTISGGGGHQARIGDASRSVFASNEIGPAAGGHGFKVTGENSGSGGVAHWVFRDNYILDAGASGTFNRIVSMVPQFDDSPGPVKRGLVESNFCKGSTLSDSHDDRTCFFIAEMQDMTFRNNIVDQTRRFASLFQARVGADSWPEISNLSVVNNTSAYTTGTSGDKGVVIEIASGLSNVRVANNLFYHNVSYGPGMVSCGGSSCSQNSNNLKIATNPFVASPPFSTPWQFRLQGGSAPVGAGTANSESFFDFEGALRTGSRDAGAWQLVGGGPPPPPVLIP